MSATITQWRGGTTAESMDFTGAPREITVDTSLKTLRVHDGVTPGGSRLATKAEADAASITYAGVAAGTANAIILTPVTAVTALVAGKSQIRFIAQAVNTGIVTLQVSGLSPIPVVRADGQALAGGELQIGAVKEVVYDGSVWRLTQASSVAELPGLTAAMALLMPKAGGSPFTGNLKVLKANPSLLLDKGATGETASITGQIGGVSRWILELGTASGNNFSVTRLDSSGVVLNVPLLIDAATGKMTIDGDLAVTGNISGANALDKRALPVGTTLEFSGPNLPPGFLWEDGANVSRATYAALFAAIGTTYGAGNGTTTFTLPDSRGRVAAGKDNMGGTAANRLNAYISGITLGAVGGDQRLHAHGHGVNDPTHAHSVADPTHTHGIYDPSHTHAMSGTDAVMRAGGGFNIQAGDGASSDYSGIGVYPATTGISLYAAGTGIGIYGAYTGISIQASGAGGAENLQPTIIKNKIIFTGVFA